MDAPPSLWCSIDPGDSHVGFAVWNGDRCVLAFETTPTGAVLELERLAAADLKLIVLESFHLYPHLAQQQAGSDMKTAQLIGVIKYIARGGGVPLILQTPTDGKSVYKIRNCEERPSVRSWASYGNGKHAKDAEAHGVLLIRKMKRRRAGYRE